MPTIMRLSRLRKLCRISVCILLGMLLFSFPIGSAIVPPVAVSGLVSLLSKALPVVETVVSKIFSGTKQNDTQKNNISKLQTDTAKGMTELQGYLKQQQLLATTVTSAGRASSKVAVMNQIIADQTKLSGAQLAHFRTAWNIVSATLDAIKKADLDTSVLSDSNEKLAVTKIIEADGDIKKSVDDFISKYKANSLDETNVAELKDGQVVVAELYTRFQNLTDISGVALKTVTDALSAVVNAAAEQKPTTTPAPGKTPKINTGVELLFKNPDGFKALQKLGIDSEMAIEKSISRDFQIPKGAA